MGSGLVVAWYLQKEGCQNNEEVLEAPVSNLKKKCEQKASANSALPSTPGLMAFRKAALRVDDTPPPVW